MLTPLYKDFEPICAEGPRFGNMLKCTNIATNEVVAIKILNIPENQKIYGVPYKILKHVSILKMLSHPNIVRSPQISWIHSFWSCKNEILKMMMIGVIHSLLKVMETVDDVFLVFEFFDTSLRRYIDNCFLFDIRGLEKACQFL